MDNISQNPFEQRELKIEEVKGETLEDENLFKKEEEKKKVSINKETVVKIISSIFLVITLGLFVFFLYKVIKTSDKEYELDKLKFTISSDYNVKKEDNKLELSNDKALVTINLIKEEKMLMKMNNPANLKAFQDDNHLLCTMKTLTTSYLECQKEGETVLLLNKKNNDHLLINIKGNASLKEMMKIAMNARYS